MKAVVTIPDLKIISKEVELITTFLEWNHIKYTTKEDLVSLMINGKGKPTPTVNFYDEKVCTGFDEVYNYITHEKGYRLC